VKAVIDMRVMVLARRVTVEIEIFVYVVSLDALVTAARVLVTVVVASPAVCATYWA
jgi:hypothetical protein